MGLNLVIACHEHKLYSYSMRGEEPRDVQWWMRAHAACFTNRKVDVYRDADDYPDEADGYEPAWEHENRPAVRSVL